MSEIFIRNLDILVCEHGGIVDVQERGSRDTNFEMGRVLTDKKLVGATVIRCTNSPKKCTVVKKITKGMALEVKVDGEVPLLRDLEALTDTGAKVTVSHKLSDQLKLEEGYSATAYRDKTDAPCKPNDPATAGFCTVGYGFNLDDKGTAKPLIQGLGLDYDKVWSGTQQVDTGDAGSLLDTMAQKKQTLVSNTFPGSFPAGPGESSAAGAAPPFDDEQRSAMVDFAYNNKDFPTKWPSLEAAVKAGDADKAAYEMGHNKAGGASKYVTDVGADRSSRVIAMMRGAHVCGSPDDKK